MNSGKEIMFTSSRGELYILFEQLRASEAVAESMPNHSVTSNLILPLRFVLQQLVGLRKFKMLFPVTLIWVTKVSNSDWLIRKSPSYRLQGLVLPELLDWKCLDIVCKCWCTLYETNLRRIMMTKWQSRRSDILAVAQTIIALQVWWYSECGIKNGIDWWTWVFSPYNIPIPWFLFLFVLKKYVIAPPFWNVIFKHSFDLF